MARRISLDDPHFEEHAQEYRDSELDKYLAEGESSEEEEQDDNSNDEGGDE
jgi:hypothetical protein